MITKAEWAKIKAIRANVKRATAADKQFVIDVFAREVAAGSVKHDDETKRIFAKAAHDGFVPQGGCK